MKNFIIWFVLLVIVVLFIILIVVLLKKQKKQDNGETERTVKKLTSVLENSRQHSKFQKLITLRAIFSAAFTISLFSCLLSFMLLPVFQIKLELFGVVLSTKNFSALSNLIDLYNETNEELCYFTDANKWEQIATFMVTGGTLILVCVHTYLQFYPFNSEKRTLGYVVCEKANLDNRAQTFEYNVLILIAISIGLQIYTIINYKNAEYNFTSELPYSIAESGRYLIYSNQDGFILKVFQNDFKYCNGVSGYLAITIILLALAIAAFAASLVLKNKLKKQIAKEEIITNNETVAQ